MVSGSLSPETRFAERYLLIDRLHAGSGSEVWLAEDRRASIAVALKVLGREASERDAQRELFRREYDIARGLNHPHTVRVLNWVDGERVAYAMQYIDGTDFADLAGRPAAVWAPALMVVVDTLIYWHRKGVVHGDVKPANLLLDRRGVTYLADFGSAATLHGSAPDVRGGTPAYTGPEQRAGNAPHTGDDAYALAQVIAELATGEPDSTSLSDLSPGLQRWVEDARGPVAERPTLGALCDALAAAGFERGPVDLKALGVTLRRPASSVAAATVEAPTEALPHGAFERPMTQLEREPGGIRPRTVLLGLVAIALFGALFSQGLRWLGGSADDAAPAPQTEAAAPDEPADAPAENGAPGDSEAPPDEQTEPVDRVAERREADAQVARLISLLDILELRGAELWGGAPYATGRERYAEGDRAYLAGDYTTANERYREALAILSPLTDQIEVEFERAMRAGDAAMADQDSDAARRAFERALAITPGNALAELGLARAQSLDEVLGEMAAGTVAERAGDLPAALERYEAALALDAQWQPAADAVARIRDALDASAFQRAMSRGFEALDAGRFADARRAFGEARRLDAADPAPADALLQVQIAERLARIDGFTRQAEQAEREERWADALSHWQAVLEVDDSVAVAQAGTARVRNRLSLNRAAAQVLDNPDRLAEMPALRSASAVLEQLQALEPRGPRLAARIDDLSALLRQAAIPIPVTLRSDGETTVTLLRVAQLGEFEQTELRLRPGLYTVVGTRRGYVDARQQFRVRAGEPAPSVFIACEQPI